MKNTLYECVLRRCNNEKTVISGSIDLNAYKVTKYFY